MLKGLRLNLACGEDRKPGFLGVDQIQSEGVDIVWDLNKYPLPFDDNSVDEIICNHFIEHVDDLVKFMEELYRIMKPGSSGIITAPYWSHVNAWRDPTHKRGIGDQTIFFFNEGWRKANGKTLYGIKADFDVGFRFEIDPKFVSTWNDMSESERTHAYLHYTNVVLNVIFNISKRG
jgi:SAM-dependent methyltransferase